MLVFRWLALSLQSVTELHVCRAGVVQHTMGVALWSKVLGVAVTNGT